MKRFGAALLILSALISAPALAKDTPSSSETIDEIIVTGTLQRDTAMAAYLAGDYVTAEIEFERNAFCALRATRNFRAGVSSENLPSQKNLLSAQSFYESLFMMPIFVSHYSSIKTAILNRQKSSSNDYALFKGAANLANLKRKLTSKLRICKIS